MSYMMKELADRDIDVAGVDVKNKIIDVLLSDQNFKDLSKDGFEVEVLEVKGVTKSPDEQYKDPAEIEQITLDYYNQFPQITQRISIGKSLLSGL